MYKSLLTLINNNYYSSLEDIMNRLNTFFATNRLNAKEYSELVELAKSKFN